jgi:hypothetical protein
VNGSDILNPVRRSGRTLRTPTVTLTTGHIACLVRGSGEVLACIDSHRMLEGPLHRETFTRFPPGEDRRALRWVRLNLTRYAGARVHFEFTPDEHHQLEVARIVDGEPPDKYASTTNDQTASSVSIETRSVSPVDDANCAELARAWWAERDALRAEVRWRSQLAIAAMDLTGEDDQLLIRGNVRSPAEAVPRRFLEAIDGHEPMSIEQGSGRLQLAARINDSQNPLTSRVIVNRIWQHLLGEGIVRSPDNFGVLGEPPTHPELLDFLASEFLANGRSIKRTIRSIVLSNTYAMSAETDDETIVADPANRLWSRVPQKRLEAEAIRDTLIFLSGRFDPTVGGPSVPIYLTDFMQGRGRPAESGPLDGAGRRSIYLAARRNFLSPFSLAFDAPTPFSTMGRRTRSNVPAQALALLNDPLVHHCAHGWAKAILSNSADSVEDRVDRFYRTGLARSATTQELRRLDDFVAQEQARRGVDGDDLELWADVAHVVVNTKEFVYLP